MIAPNSIIAFYKGKQAHVTKGQQRVLSALLSCPSGLTDFQIAERYRIGINCVSNRVGELLADGFIVVCGNQTVSGNKRRVTKINPRRTVRVAE